MANLDTLINKVVEDAKAEGQEKYAQAKAAQEQEISEFEEKLNQQESKEKAAIEKQANNLVNREKQSASNKMNTDQLAQKQELFAGVYQKAIDSLIALPEEEFVQLVRGALGQLESTENTRLKLGELSKDQLNEGGLQTLQAEFPGLTFNEETVRNEGGFVLEQETIDYNFFYGRLIDEKKLELSKELASRAFS